jgi:transposase
MKNEDEPENLKKRIHDLEREISQLEGDLKKERNEKEAVLQQKKELENENKDLKKQLAQLLGSAPTLAASDKTAEAGGIPSSKTFYRRNRQEGEKKTRGGQPGHAGHGREKPAQNSPPLYVELDECPDCNTSVGEPVYGAEQSRIMTDIPLPRHNIYEIVYLRYWCNKCKKLVRGEVPWLPPNQQFGPAVASWIVYQRMLGLSIGKIQSSLYETYEITISEATILKLEKWVANILKEDYGKLHKEIVKAAAVNADETGFRIDGKNSWLWVFTSTLCSYYKIAPTRDHTVPKETLEGFNGVLGRDAWKPYDVVKCSGHQLDLLHVNRWLERAEIKHRIEPRSLLTSKPAKLMKRGRPPGNFLEFVDGVRSILKRAVEYTEKDPSPSMKERENVCTEVQKDMKELLDKEWTDEDAIRISKELRTRQNMLFTFMEYKGVPWHNNDAERAIRQGVLHRKISGGRRTWTGAQIFEVVLSVYETTKKRGQRFIGMLKKKLEMPPSIESLNTSTS